MILFVDDETRRMESYKEEMELSCYEVKFLQDVDSAWRFFENNFEKIDLLILDLIMPPGQIFKDENTEDGLRTGIFLFKKIREKATALPTVLFSGGQPPGGVQELPVIIFTNVSDAAVREIFRRKEKCWFIHKEDVLPFELAEKIKEILESS